MCYYNEYIDLDTRMLIDDGHIIYTLPNFLRLRRQEAKHIYFAIQSLVVVG